jgi:hypothetical protein
VEIKQFLYFFIFLGYTSVVLAQVYQPDHYEAQRSHFKYFKDSTMTQVYQTIPSIKLEVYNGALEFKTLSPSIGLSYNSARPFGYNDGSLWKGKGLTTDLSVGVSGNWKNLNFTFFPRIFWSQNSAFDLSPRVKYNKSIYNYQFNIIGDLDYVQRYGSQPYVAFDWGQTELRYSNKWMTLAASTANYTLGPGSQHSILMSRQAGGFPHIEIGTNQFVSISIKNIDLGSILFKNRIGQLTESEYFDSITENDTRYINTFSIGYKPPFLDGFKIGVERVFYQNMEFVELKDLFRGFWYFNNRDRVAGIDGDTVNDRFDQMASFHLEYIVRKPGLRFYGEFSKNDFNGSFRDFLISTAHARGYTLGFDKMFVVDKGKVLLTYETSNVARTSAFTYRPEPSYYLHYKSVGGYTNQGQIMGLGTGPGSHVHTISLKVLNENSLFETTFHRVQIDEDYFQEVYGFLTPDYSNRHLRSAEYAAFFSYTNWVKKFAYTVELIPSIRINQDFILENDQPNLYAGINLTYSL